MIDQQKIENLNQLADKLASSAEPTFAGTDYAPFDVSRPNLHESKKEFLEEMNTVSAAVDHLESVLHLLSPLSTEPNPPREAMIQRVHQAIDQSVRQELRKRKVRGGSAQDVTIQNFRDTGFVDNALSILPDLVFALKRRLTELGDQEKQFWSVSNRPPNHYARSIALRFARFFAVQTGKRPTFGTSGQGGHPSTDFGRSLEEVFEILGIGSNVKSVAVWAIDQLTDEDLSPRRSLIFGINGLVRPDDPLMNAMLEPMPPKGR